MAIAKAQTAKHDLGAYPSGGKVSLQEAVKAYCSEDIQDAILTMIGKGDTK